MGGTGVGKGLGLGAAESVSCTAAEDDRGELREKMTGGVAGSER